MKKAPNTKTLVIALLVIVIGFAGYSILTRPDPRSPGEKIGDAIDALPNGLEDAGRQLESRTPGEKLQDAAEDAKDDAKKAINQP